MNKECYKSHQNAGKSIINYETRMVFKGQIIRIFCSDCNDNMKIICLPRRWLHTYSCPIRHNSNDICFNHPTCYQCQKFIKVHETIKESWKCRYCKNLYCSKCKNDGG